MNKIIIIWIAVMMLIGCTDPSIKSEENINRNNTIEESEKVISISTVEENIEFFVDDYIGNNLETVTKKINSNKMILKDNLIVTLKEPIINYEFEHSDGTKASEEIVQVIYTVELTNTTDETMECYFNLFFDEKFTNKFVLTEGYLKLPNTSVSIEKQSSVRYIYSVMFKNPNLELDEIKQIFDIEYNKLYGYFNCDNKPYYKLITVSDL